MYNMNFSERSVIHCAQMEWQESPSPTVFRKPLEREDKESGHTSSMVKFTADASFKTHPHPAGEEIFVLKGGFSDEFGDNPAGSYIRNPPGSEHAPFSKEGCEIFVKLNQFSMHDTELVRINTLEREWLPGQGGLQVMPLHQFENEHSALVKWPAGEKFKPHRHFGGEEIFVLSGTFCDEHGEYPAHTWIRSPHMSQHHPYVKEETVIFVKTGHLPLLE